MFKLEVLGVLPMQINTLLKLSLKILLFLKVAITLSFPFGINSVTSVEVKIFSNFFSSDFLIY